MCHKQCVRFQSRYKPQKEGGHTSFDITVVSSYNCNGYDLDRVLLCSPSICYLLTRTGQVLLIKMCEVHSQLRVVLYIYNLLFPLESKGGKLDQYS